jgi:acyl carrier protein
LDFFLLFHTSIVESGLLRITIRSDRNSKAGTWEDQLETKEKLRSFITENFLFGNEDTSFDDKDSFLETGIIDSTGILELIGFIEDEFGFDVEDKELIPDNFDSVHKLTVYIDNKVQALS